MSDPENTTALHQRDGIDRPQPLNPEAKTIVARKSIPDASTLISGIQSRDIAALSRAITLIESTNHAHSQISAAVLSACLPASGKSVRIGITGVPGVGKSTFIEAFGTYLTSLGKKVAVLAIDPSSSVSRGSILGDKTRMEELVKDPNAFIRPSASGKTLGGVARSTRESITLCEAFGFDVVIVETVGVGQSETAVHEMTDFFLLLKIAGAGDELQGIKRGIMEMADLIVINKADGDNVKKARLARTEFDRALHFFPPHPSGQIPHAVTASSVTSEGIPEIWNVILNYCDATKTNGYFESNRNRQQLSWFESSLNEQLIQHFHGNEALSSLLAQMKTAVISQKMSPFTAAAELMAVALNGGTNPDANISRH
ncbi:MAG: methylmalonyl Co-A mutase-associated GTPase MeaB [Chitinophagaceae bacterium]|nr:MAG: methylmalonyl Co-A mutase-associated GTPase MeaB [Chitinophagaceae bacterium]